MSIINGVITNIIACSITDVMCKISYCVEMLDIKVDIVTLIGLILLILFVLIFLYLNCRTNFYWEYYYIEDTHIYVIKKDSKAEYINVMKVLPMACFNNKITGHYDWQDVVISQIGIEANDATLMKIKYYDGKENTTKSIEDDMVFVNDVDRCNFEIGFPHNEIKSVKTVKLAQNLKYDLDKGGKLFVEVGKPTFKLELVLKVKADINIYDIRERCVHTTGYDKKAKVRNIKKTREYDYNVYKYTIWFPKIFHTYEISWSW